MPCYFPLRGWRTPFPNKNGKYEIVFTDRNDESVRQVEIPCGQCIGCRLDYSRKWAIRCVHEASLHDDNCFITLTYDDEHLPLWNSLEKSAFQKFMKRLRKFTNGGVRFFHCGEYGERFGRPHYHAILFGYDFPDKVLIKRDDDIPLYTSSILSRLWPFGYSTIGAVTFESAAYVARYVIKKVTGPLAKDHYTVMDPLTGELFERQPEYVLMSRRPGIGKEWFEKFASDVYPGDFVISRGLKVKPPRYYDSLYEIVDPVSIAGVRDRRRDLGYAARDNSTLDRLKVREKVARSKLSLSKPRSVE